MALSKAADKRISKRMSYVLRHRPDVFDLTMDEQGWVLTSDLLKGFEDSNSLLTLEELQEIVEFNPKKRFELNDDGLQIRARQGHSVDVDLGYLPAIPPDVLYHGTPARNQEIIEVGGLLKMKRHHVHLSPDIQTATTLGTRGSKHCVIFEIQASEMSDAGYVFYQTLNEVWLVDAVPPEFLMILSP